MNIARFPRPVLGRIPNFAGAEVAAAKLARLPAFQDAQVVKVNPDAPQLMVRYQAVMQGKRLLTPTPRLREGFLLLEAAKLPKSALRAASSISGAFRYGRKVALDEIPQVDLLVVGCVAVSRDGPRLGKGEGYGEIEYAVLREMGCLAADVPVCTTVHDLQVIDAIPWEVHDVPVDVIVTPTQIVRTHTKYPKPSGILWERLTEERIRAIPLLGHLRAARPISR